MPRYFFETDDDNKMFRGEEAVVLSGPAEARREALSALPDMARDNIPNGDERTFRSTVFDEFGEMIFEGTLTLRGVWHPGKPAGDPSAA